MSIQIKFSTVDSITDVEDIFQSWLLNFKQAISNMNISALELLLDDDIIINDQTKWEFLTEIRNTFNRSKAKGNSELTLKMEKCLKCFYGCPVHSFYGEAKYAEIGFYIKEENGVLVDITICNIPGLIIE